MQLVSTPNVFPYQKFIETEKAGYLVRQYFLNNLYDRIRFVFLYYRFLIFLNYKLSLTIFHFNIAQGHFCQ